MSCGLVAIFSEVSADLSLWLESVLIEDGYSVEQVRSSSELLDIQSQLDSNLSALILDYSGGGQNGAQVLTDLRAIYPCLPIIVLSGPASPQQIVQVMKNGASDFLTKPVNREDLRKALTSVPEARNVPSAAPIAKMAAQWNKNIFYGSNPYMKELESMIARIGWSLAPLLIQGETGVGKEVLARELHSRSSRANKRFLKLNCAALPSELVESELFGYERGAFTGAFQKKIGMFELADGGTIFLDEIGDMDFKLQAKLLQVLQDNEFQRLGGKETVRVDVRVIAATHCDLEKAITKKRFREDLFYRLNVISLRVPPLRERKEDIFEIAAFLARKHQQPDSAPPEFESNLRQAMLDYDWPGNIRELENIIRKLLILDDPALIARELRQKMERLQLSHTDDPNPYGAGEHPAKSTILGQVSRAKEHAEKIAILTALESTNWNRKKAAILLKIEYKALLYKMRKLSIEDKMATLPSVVPARMPKPAGLTVT